MRPAPNFSAAFVLAATAALAGCSSMAAFQQAGEDTRKGGNFDKKMAAGAEEQKRLAEQKVVVTDKELLVKREIERMDQRIAGAQEDSRRSDADLQAALDQKRITRAKYDELKKEQASLRGELGALQIKDANDKRKAATAAPDPAAEAEKEKKLAALKARQKTLEAELAKALAVK